MAEIKENDAFSDSEGPVSTFASLFAEGDGLSKQGDYQKAVDAFSKVMISAAFNPGLTCYGQALNLKTGEKNCLIARSKCYLLLGDPNSALNDAQEALKEDPTFYKAIFQKAEALYSKGDFEMALLHYHRGHFAKPEVDEFRLGIQKAKEAINNAIGNPKDFKIVLPKQNSNRQASSKRKTANQNLEKDTAVQQWHEKQLLGELYEDKLYLKEFLTDEEHSLAIKSGIKPIISSTLQYLDSRIEFWRQQKPIYARGHSKTAVKLSSDEDNKKAKNTPEDLEKKQIHAFLRNIQRVYESADYNAALRFAELLLHKLTPNGENDENPSDLSIDPHEHKLALSKCYRWLGHIYLKLNHKSTSVSYFQKDLALSRKAQLDCQEPLRNLSSVYLQFKRYQSAIPLLTNLLKLHTESERLDYILEILHDLTNAYLETGDPINAKRIWDKHPAPLSQHEGPDASDWSLRFRDLHTKIEAANEHLQKTESQQVPEAVAIPSV